MNRKERRAAAHKDSKLARKACFPTEQPQPITPAPPPKPPISEAQLDGFLMKFVGVLLDLEDFRTPFRHAYLVP